MKTKPSAPMGLGLYLRVMPEVALHARVQRLKDHGVRWAAVGGPWYERQGMKWINTPIQCRRIVEVLIAAGIEPYVWGYPWAGRERDFAWDLESCCAPGVAGVLIDPELGLKDKDEATRLRHGRDLFWEVVKLNPYRVVGFTSYGLAKQHPTFPWEAFAEPGGFNPLEECDYGSPQLYDMTPSNIRKGLEQYRELGFDVLVPSFGTYRFAPDGSTPRMTGPELGAHLQAFADLREEFGIHGMIGWSEAQVSKGGWEVLDRFADVFV